MSTKAPPLTDIDPAELEKLLSGRLKDPTPTVLQKDMVGLVYETPSKYLSYKKTQVAPQQTDVPFPSQTPLPDPPQRNESSMHRRKLRAMPNFTEKQLAKTNSSLSTAQEPDHLKDQCVCIIRELVTSESTFVSDIEFLFSLFTASLCEYAHSKEIFVNDMLQSLCMLVLFQRRFLHSLTNVAETNIFAIAQLFSLETAGFRLYINYSTAYHRISKELDKLDKEDAAWRKLVTSAQAQNRQSSHCCRLGLRDLLIRPIQRICKYPLFLSGLLKHTRNSDRHVHAELSRSLSFIKSICVGIDKEQHHSEAERLRNAILNNYYDNQKLPVRFVARLGMVSLSGLLKVHNADTASFGASELFGCVLFKRFIIVFGFKRPTHLVPQYWFPMHTMALVDDDTEYAYSWQLQHLRSGQYMQFSARSSRERDLWLSRLKEAISVSIAKIPQPQTGRQKSGAMLPLTATNIISQHQNQQRQRQRDIFSTKHSSGKTRSHGQGNIMFWRSSSSSVRNKESEFEQVFKDMTSPEIIRINTLERIQCSAPVSAMTTLSVPHQQVPQLSPPSLYSTISSSFAKAPSQRHISLYDSEDHCMAYKGDSVKAKALGETTGIVYLQSPCQFQRECKCQQSKFCVCTNNNTNNGGNGRNNGKKSTIHPDTLSGNQKDRLSERLLGTLEHLSPDKQEPQTLAPIHTGTTIQSTTAYNTYSFWCPSNE